NYRSSWKHRPRVTKDEDGEQAAWSGRGMARSACICTSLALCYSVRTLTDNIVTVYFTGSQSIKRFSAITGLEFLSTDFVLYLYTATSPQDLRFILNYSFALMLVAAGSWLLRSAWKTESATLSIPLRGSCTEPRHILGMRSCSSA